MTLGNAQLLEVTPKACSHKKKNIKLDFIKVKYIALPKASFRKWKDNSQTVRKYLQIFYLIKNLYSNVERMLVTQVRQLRWTKD